MALPWASPGDRVKALETPALGHETALARYAMVNHY